MVMGMDGGVGAGAQATTSRDNIVNVPSKIQSLYFFIVMTFTYLLSVLRILRLEFPISTATRCCVINNRVLSNWIVDTRHITVHNKDICQLLG